MGRRCWPWKKRSSDKAAVEKAAMGRRCWPWKKRSSDKAAVEKAAAVTIALASDPSESIESHGDQSKQDNHKKPKYVQITAESYSHLTGMEDQVKSFEEQVNTLELNDKLSAAQSEMTHKENLVKQYAKVAEEVVSGCEAEASTLKNHLESVTRLKLTAEDRASHLDGALKECMRQIRNLKEEHEQKLHDVVLNKTKQFDKIKHELEAKIANLDQELLRSAAENSALSRSLQKHSNMLFKISEEKAQAEAEIELLKSNIESCEKEINFLKYELHIAAKEQEIRNEEKNMSVRSAEVANKQHLEGVKKIAKLEAECQRLRGLVRKKLPRPTALAQTANKLQSLEAQARANGEHKSPPKSTVRMPTEGAFSQNASLPPSLNSMSADNVSCAGSWATTLLSELSHIKKERSFDSPHKSECVSHMELMDDFLEMEKLVNLSNDMNGAVSSPDTSNARCEIANIDTLIHVTTGNDSQLKNHNETDPSEHQASPSEEASAPCYKHALEPSPLMKLQSRISIVLESLSKEADMQKLQEDLRQIVQEVHDSIRPQSARSIVETTVSSETASESQLSLDDPRANVKRTFMSLKIVNHAMGLFKVLVKNYQMLCLKIHDFVIFLGKEAEAVDGASPDGTRINAKLDEFSATYVEVVSSGLNLVNFVLDLSQVLRNASELHFNILGYKTSETEMSTSDCIDTSLETRTEELQTEVDLLQEKIECLDNELQEEKKSHHGALARCQDLEEQLRRIESCPAADIVAKTNQARSEVEVGHEQHVL